MTIQNRDEIRKNIKTGFNVANFLLIITSVFYIGNWVGQIEKQNIQRHEETQELKIQIAEQNKKMEEQAKTFRTLYVPRTEISVKIDMILSNLTEMKDDIKTLERQ